MNKIQNYETNRKKLALNIHKKFNTGFLKANKIINVLQNYNNRNDTLHEIAKIIEKGLLEAKKIKNFIDEQQ